MAAIKKSKKQGKPGAGLAITLVFFILLSIGLGVWGYYGYEGQDKLREAAKTAATSEAAAKIAEKYYKFLASDYALALGYDLDPERKKDYPDIRKAFMTYHEAPDGGGEFKVLGKSVDKDKVLDKLIVDENEKDLAFNKDTLTYGANYRDRVKTYITRAEDVEKVADARQDSFIKANARFDELKKNYDTWWNKVFTEIKEGNDNVIAAAKATYKQMETALADARRLNEQLLVLQESKEKEETRLNKKIKQLDDQLKTALADRPAGGVGGGGGAGPKDIHALVLDISGFRPLWDRPLGEITALDLANRLVYVRPNRNINQSFKPGTSFLIFARGADGSASGVLKGSIEVVRESSDDSYACRITSFYDVERGEIKLSDPAKLLGIRVSKNALREGDLIFNMFYGTHVALAGVFDLDGEPAAAPAELSRQMDATIASLKRRGIEVDAYIDPITGLVKGAITQKTRFLIRGDDLAIAAMVGEKLPKAKMEGEEGKKDEAPAVDRATAMEESLRRMKQQAVDNGLFLISLPNFTTVIGYVSTAHFGETTRVMRIPHLPAATTLAVAGIGFVSKTDVRLADFAGEWEGSGWELSLTEEGKAKVNLVIDRGGIPEVRLTPGDVSLRAGKYMLNVFGPSPMELEVSVSVGGVNLQLEDPTGKLAPPVVVLRKR